MAQADSGPQRTPSSTAILCKARLGFHVIVGATIILAVGAGYGHLRFGSLSAALSAMRGDSLLANPAYQVVNGVHPGSRVRVQYALTNASDRPIKVIGINTSCSCTTVADIPMSLAPRQTKSVTATIVTREGQVGLDGSIRIYTDEPSSAEVVIGYSVRFVQASRTR